MSDEADAVWVDVEALGAAAAGVRESFLPAAGQGSLAAPGVSVTAARETLVQLASMANGIGPVVAANVELIVRAVNIGAMDPWIADGGWLDSFPVAR